MKKMVGIFVLMSVFSVVAIADSFSIKFSTDDLVQIGSRHSSSATVRELEERIWQLERAVSQLQRQVFQLSEAPNAKKEEKTISCYIKTTFDGTHTASGKTQMEAKGKVLKLCGNSLSCKEDNVKCDS